MGPAQVVDSLRGSAPAPIGWARHPLGGRTREHAWTERPTPPPAPGASNQIGQNLPIPLGRTHKRTLSPATTVVPPRPLLPRRWLGRSFPSPPTSPRPRRRTGIPPQTALIRRRLLLRYRARATRPPRPSLGCPARTARVRRPPLLRATATRVLAARWAHRPRWGIASRRRLRLHPAPPAYRVARPRTVRLRRRPT